MGKKSENPPRTKVAEQEHMPNKPAIGQTDNVANPNGPTHAHRGKTGHRS